jgi:hypothetical protein
MMYVLIGLALLPAILLLMSGKPGYAVLSLLAIPAWFVHPVAALAGWLSSCALATREI